MSALLKPTQLELFDAAAEADFYHYVHLPGFFSVLQFSGGRKRQRSYPLSEMHQVIHLLDKNTDTWISQAEFTRPNRRVVNLWRLGLLFIDLDTYNIPGLRDKSPDKQVSELLFFCGLEGIPKPSLINFSGRGLQAKWFLDKPLPRAALPRWNRVQLELVNKLADFGADAQAKDASRVLRLVETVNTKNNEMCAVVHVTEQSGLPIQYCFEYLCEMLLPFTRDDLAILKAERHEEYLKRKAHREKFTILSGGAEPNHLHGFSGRQLAWHRLEDLRTIAKLRGGVKPGQRMLHLFWQINFLILSGATNSNQMYHEAKALARQLDSNWEYDSSALSSLYERAVKFGNGEEVEFDGQKYPALYTPKNDTLINLFEITDDEQRKLKTIITPAMARERDAERKKVYRMEKGGVSEAEYNAKRAAEMNERKEKAMALREKGLSYRAIAHELKVSVASVHKYLKENS